MSLMRMKCGRADSAWARSGWRVGRWAAPVLVCLGLSVTAGQANAQTVEYIHTDALGSPVATTNASGVVIERQVYEPYGAPMSHGPTDGPGFTGHVEDSSTGLTYMQQRYYDASTGRFVSVDPLTYDGNGDARLWGRYIYGFNNPYSFKDPDGRCPICIPIVIGLGIYLTSGPANAPAPGEPTGDMPIGEQIASAIPNGGRVTSLFKMTARQADKLRPKPTGTAGGARAGKDFTRAGKAEVKADNAARNAGQTTCENCGTPTVPAQQSRAGVTPPVNETHVDHIIPKSQNGDGSPSNGQVLCRECNLKKSDTL